MSALSDNDEICSELTELCQAQEVFTVTESAITSIDDSERSGGSIFRENRESQEVFVVKSSAVAAAAMRNKDLSLLDIVHQESQSHVLSSVKEGSDREQTMEEKEGALLLDMKVKIGTFNSTVTKMNY